MDADVQKSLQNRIDNGNYYKNDDQQVGSSIVDSQSGALVAISGGRHFKDIVDRNQATDAHPTGSSLKPFLAYGPAIENMQWATNHGIQDESSYQVDGTTFRNYDTNGHGLVKMYDALRQSFNIQRLKLGNKRNRMPVKVLRKISHLKSDLIMRRIQLRQTFLVVRLQNSHLLN